ncbi:hypothetical protein [Actinoallomurus vinaceus]|uniref:hypothetical protein n=1 Tax=Actinoallomurus vinaceus TaxID=1080074 RepID=UPI0031E69132
MNELQQSVATILSNWNAPDSFDQYSSEMHQALDHQRTAMNDLNGVIDNLKTALSTAKQDTFDRFEIVAAALIGIILAALASVTIAIVTGGTILAGCVAAAIALLMALIAFIAAREKSLHNETKTLHSQINQVNNLLKGQNLREVTPPPPPSINWDGYHSIHEPIPTVEGRG